MKKSLTLITGATSGIGESLARTLSNKKHPLLLVGRDETKLKALVQELSLNGFVEGYVCDLSDINQRQKLIDVIAEQCPTLVINNAGFGYYGTFESHSLEENRQLFAVNVEAVMELTWASVNAWKRSKKRGTVLNVSSVAGFLSMPGMALYSASKAFVTSFSLAVDYEMKKEGIRVLVSCPGQVDTPFAERAAKRKISQEKGIVIKKEQVIKNLLKQIETGKQLHIIDWRYRLLLWLIKRFIPFAFVQKIIWNSIQKRL